MRNHRPFKVVFYFKQVTIFSATRLKDEKLNRRTNRTAVWLNFLYFNLPMRNPGIMTTYHTITEANDLMSLNLVNSMIIMINYSYNYCQFLP